MDTHDDCHATLFVFPITFSGGSGVGKQSAYDGGRPGVRGGRVNLTANSVGRRGLQRWEWSQRPQYLNESAMEEIKVHHICCVVLTIYSPCSKFH